MTKQKESGEKKSRTRAFGSAFMLTLCLLILGCGFFVADINTRQMTFGNTEPRLEYAVENGVLRLKAVDGRTVELPPSVREWAGRIWNLLPARWRAGGLPDPGRAGAGPRVAGCFGTLPAGRGFINEQAPVCRRRF